MKRIIAIIFMLVMISSIVIAQEDTYEGEDTSKYRLRFQEQEQTQEQEDVDFDEPGKQRVRVNVRDLRDAAMIVDSEEELEDVESILEKIDTENRIRLNGLNGIAFEYDEAGDLYAEGRKKALFLGFILWPRAERYRITNDGVLMRQKHPLDILWKEDGERMMAYQEVDARAARSMIYEKGDDLIIVDVSSAYDDGHIPGAISIPLMDLRNGDYELEKGKMYLVYCHITSAAVEGAQILVDAGYQDVYLLQGNYKGWLDRDYPVEK